MNAAMNIAINTAMNAAINTPEIVKNSFKRTPKLFSCTLKNF